MKDVVMPARKMTNVESDAFDEFCRLNVSEIRRVFIKYSIGTQHHG